MSLEENKAIIRRHWEATNNQDYEVLDELMAIDFKDNDPFPGQASGREGYTQTVRFLFKVFPDSKITTEDMLAEGDKVAVLHTIRGTHRGEFMGIPATGKKITITRINIYRIVNGKIVERWGGYRDSNTPLLDQLKG